jgi:hypothetical protein
VSAASAKNEGLVMKGESYDDERFWAQIGSGTPTFLGFWTHR